MTELPEEIGREIIRRHFPNAPPDKAAWHALWLSPPSVFVAPEKMVKVGDDAAEAIEAFQRALREAWAAYLQIPLAIRKARPEIAREDSIDYPSFARLVRNATGDAVSPGQERRFPPAIASMRENLSLVRRISVQSAENEFEQKVALVWHCRSAWQTFTDREAPKKTTDGSPFMVFVTDVIKGAGKPWGYERTLKAWDAYVKKTGLAVP